MSSAKSGSAPGRGKRVAIVQSNYVPWKGYFDLIASVDEFILYDDAQYTRRDWRNRNRIKTSDGPRWLTIPVVVKGRYHQRVRDVVVSDRTWAASHWRTLTHAYARAKHFAEMRHAAGSWYEEAGEIERLSDVNEFFLRSVCRVLGIATTITRSSDYDLPEGQTERLVALCVQAAADTYLSGPAARAYLDESAFALAGVRVDWMSYDGYPTYEQLHPPFDHHVSVLDLLFNVGSEARRFLQCGAAATAPGSK